MATLPAVWPPFPGMERGRGPGMLPGDPGMLPGTGTALSPHPALLGVRGPAVAWWVSSYL